MTKAGYPKQIGSSPHKVAALIYGICAVVAFILSLGILWSFPDLLPVMLAAPLLSLIFNRERWSARIRNLILSYMVIALAVLAAAMLR